MTSQFHANGKLLLSGEYTVLDGSTALCLPVKRGQKLSVSERETASQPTVRWTAYLHNQDLWFSCELEVAKNKILSDHQPQVTKRLLALLRNIFSQKPQLFTHSLEFETHLEFNREWGLGSSSTLIALLSQWSGVDAYTLLENSFGGSGYDLACATHTGPLFYTLNGEEKEISEISFNPPFRNHLYFVYLNQKQNSREGIRKYRSLPRNPALISKISEISREMTICKDLTEFQSLMNQHEELISSHLKISKVKNSRFSDYTYGAIKSLGAWGGDFVLVAQKSDDLSYFKEKGYSTIFRYDEFAFT